MAIRARRRPWERLYPDSGSREARHNGRVADEYIVRKRQLLKPGAVLLRDRDHGTVSANIVGAMIEHMHAQPVPPSLAPHGRP